MMDATADRSARHGRLMRRVAMASVATASFLVVLKSVAFAFTHSVAMMASLADSGLDVIASSINLWAVWHALAPADHEHRFGHGKAEPLAGLAQVAFISGSAVFLIIESVSRLLAPRPIEQGFLGLIVMAVSIVLTAALVSAQRWVVTLTASPAISSDRMHYLGDLLTNLGVIVGILLASRGLLEADPVIGLGIAGTLAWTAWAVLRQSYDQLMDHELPEKDRDRIKEIVAQHREVRSMHDLRTRMAGIGRFIQFHIELDPTISLARAHELSDAVENDILAAFPSAEVIIHQDPAGVEMPAPLAKS